MNTFPESCCQEILAQISEFVEHYTVPHGVQADAESPDHLTLVKHPSSVNAYQTD